MSEIATGDGTLKERFHQDIREIVENRQRIFCDNHLLKHTAIYSESWQKVYRNLTPIESHEAISARFGEFFKYNCQYLDLARTEHEPGDWQAADELQNRVILFLNKLYMDKEMQKSLGVRCLTGLIGSKDKAAKLASHPTNIDEKFGDKDYYLVNRERTMLVLESLKSGEKIEIKKRSDFALIGEDIVEKTGVYFLSCIRATITGEIPDNIRRMYKMSKEDTRRSVYAAHAVFSSQLEKFIQHRSRGLSPVFTFFYMTRV